MSQEAVETENATGSVNWEPGDWNRLWNRQVGTN